MSADERNPAEVLMKSLSWVDTLPVPQRERFAFEIDGATQECASSKNFDRLLVLISEWKATADAIASGYTRDDQLDWLDDPEPLPEAD